jgi:CBS domain-containing protein
MIHKKNKEENLLVTDVMTTQVVTLNTEDVVSEVYQIFSELNIHHIPIVHQKDKIVGIVSKSDLERISSGMSLFTQQKKNEFNEVLYRSLRVSEIMTPQPECISSEVTLKEAILLFRENKFRALPVLENGKMIGIITPYDVMLFFAENFL